MSLKSHHGESSHSRGSQDQAVFKSGDLGMGRGLKPGAISFDTDEEQKSSFTEFFSPSRKCSVSSCHYCSFQEGTEDSSLRLSDGPDDSVRSFPSYAGVPFGTSLRQHRRLYEASRRAFPGNTSHDAGQIVGNNIFAFPFGVALITNKGTKCLLDLLTVAISMQGNFPFNPPFPSPQLT